MSLTSLLPELLEIIISSTLPEGFESLAVTCKKIYASCFPFLRRHNGLRSRFYHFAYSADPKGPSPSIAIAGELIRQIAIEPMIARYIRHADLRLDTPSSYIATRPFIQDEADRGVVNALFANSLYLRQANLDWKECFGKIEEKDNILHRTLYSQFACAFLLTLLPNIKTLVLPNYWTPYYATDKLIGIIAKKAKQSDPPCLSNTLGLAQLTELELFCRSGLTIALPLLTLAHMRSFQARSCVVTDTHLRGTNAPYYRFGENLQSITLQACCMAHVAIGGLLKDSKCLKTLSYSHSRRSDRLQCWDICRFIAAIAREVGTHLVELSVDTEEIFGSVVSGEVSMRDFRCLRQFELPLEIVMYSLASVHPPGHWSKDGNDTYSLYIGDLIPPSTSILSLILNGTNRHYEALNHLFKDFAAREEFKLPALQTIYLKGADAAKEEKFTVLLTETRKAGVALYQERPESVSNLRWGEGM